MIGSARSIVGLFLLAVLGHSPWTALQADGGTLRLAERKGNYRITVFTTPTPFRAGPVDIGVLVQQALTGELVPEARVIVCMTPRAHPGATIRQAATTASATNKLFQAAVFDLPDQGWWDVEIVVEGLQQPISVSFALEAAESPARGWEMGPWIAWPAVAILLFCVHQRLVRRHRH